MNKKRILLLSFYFKPDLSAGSFRTTALVDALIELDDPYFEIDVITTLPNRYNSFNAQATELEKKGALTIHRIKLPPHRSGILDQARAFLTFAINTLKISKNSHYDLVFATSSRLMTAVLGAWISKKKGAPLYLDIRDIFLDTIKDVLPSKTAYFLSPLFTILERLSFNRASRVNIVSRGFEPYFKNKYPSLSLSYYTNGVDEGFLQDFSFAKGGNRFDGKLFTVLYAGNIGEGQGLHLIIPLLANHLKSKVFFKIFGDGGRKDHLERALDELSLNNVELLAPVSRERLTIEYREADILFLHLNDYDAFKKVLPSKIFEYSALGKPIWAGVGGYAADFLVSEVSNVAVFPPCNLTEAINAFEQLCIKDMPRDSFIKKFRRTTIMKSMAQDMLSIMAVEVGA